MLSRLGQLLLGRHPERNPLPVNGSATGGRKFTYLFRSFNSRCRSWEEHHINCLNHVINLGVEWFIKSIKAENTDSEMPSIYTPLSEQDESEEEDTLLIALQIDDMEDSEEASFSKTMKKIRCIVKVIFLFFQICNTQLACSKPLCLQMCVTNLLMVVHQQ